MIINDLNRIPIKKNSLYIFDIDETILTFPRLPNREEILRAEYLKTKDKKLAQAKLRELEIQHFYHSHPIPTEFILDVINKIKAKNSDIIFLTARSKNLEDFTMDNLIDIGITSAEIHFSGDKGNFISEYLKDKNYRYVYFIDDTVENFRNVPLSVTCLLFKKR